MCQLFVRTLLATSLLLLAACTRDVAVSTVLEDPGGLRRGDKVYLAAREVGSVESIGVAEQTPGFTVELALYPEHAELVQSNAVAHVPLKSPPSVVLINPTETAEPVAPGGHLRGLSPLGAAVWQAHDAAAAASDFIDLFAQELDGYFESEDWARTRAQIDAEIAQLAADSREAAHRVAEELRLLLESIREDARDGANALGEEVAAIEERIARLEVEGHEALVASLRRLLDQIEAMAPSDGKPSDGKDAKEAG
jgi:ABC-type transporter Mla subunit MlaD